MKAICQICGETYAEVSIEGLPSSAPAGDGDGGKAPSVAPLRYPVNGTMFGSPDPFHGFDPPFEPSAEWRFMMCPYGRSHRPMVHDDLVRTEQGMARLPRDGSPAFLDPAASADLDRPGLCAGAGMIFEEEVARRVREELGMEMPPCGQAAAQAAEGGERAPSADSRMTEADPRARPEGTPTGGIPRGTELPGETPDGQDRGPGKEDRPTAAPPEPTAAKDVAGTGFACGICGRSFRSPAALKGHGKAHSRMGKDG